MKQQLPTSKNKLYPIQVFYLLAFIEGGIVMTVELLCGKMLAVYFGNSIIVWTSVLGVTLLGLTTGYFLGGIISEKYKNKNILFYLFLLALLFTGIIPFWGEFCLNISIQLDYLKGAIVASLLFLTPPLLCLGATTPVIISSITENVGNSGKATGRIYSISTAGGILATFFTGFYLLPEFGIKSGIIIIAGILCTIPFLHFLLNGKILVAIGAIGFTFIIIGSQLKSKPLLISKHLKIQYSHEGLLGHIFIADDLPAQKRSLFINYISQSYMHIPSGRSQWKYIHRIALYSSIKPAGSKVLLCGLGGGNLVNELHNLKFHVDAVELDSRMQHIAQRFFGVKKENLNHFVDDARHYIRTCKKKYDIVILDMSAGENQPSNVYTTECFKNIFNLLNEDGMLFLHYQNVLEGEHALAIKSLGKTLIASGFSTRLINTEQKNITDINELMLLATKHPIDLSNEKFERRDIFADPFYFPRGNKIFLDTYNFEGGIILTDNQPIMDMLHLNTLSATRGATMKSTFPALLEDGFKLVY